MVHTELELQTADSLVRQVEEIQVTVNVDGTDVDYVAQLTTIPEGRIDGDYKVSITLRRSQFSEDVFDDTCKAALIAVIARAVEKGTKNLKDYWAKNGGQQGSLSFGAGKAKSDTSASN